MKPNAFQKILLAATIALAAASVVFFLITTTEHFVPGQPQPGPVSSPPVWSDYTGNTAYGDQFQFSIRYPNNWKLEDFRGSPSLSQSSCRIGLGVGGSGAGGWIEIRSYLTKTASNTGVTTLYSDLNEPDTLLAFTSFPHDYNFELQFPRGTQECLDVYQAVLETFQEHDKLQSSS